MTRPAPDIAKDLREYAENIRYSNPERAAQLREAADALERQHEALTRAERDLRTWIDEDTQWEPQKYAWATYETLADDLRAALGGDGE